MNEAPNSKPCLALMGEFSAGKSTLANLLIGKKHLPEQVVATQLPPVWLSYGEDHAYRVDLEGEQCELEISKLDAAPLESTAYIKVFSPQELLLECDLLDMPGISDPNMSADIWQRTLGYADGVIWCSHATQAWRQSEAAVWSQQDPSLFAKSLLLLTRIDKLVNEGDRGRVLRRVRQETEGLFRECIPISLLHAVNANDDLALWEKSGASEFARALAALLRELAQSKVPDTRMSQISAKSAVHDIPAFSSPKSETELCKDTEDETTESNPALADAVRILPRRIKVQRSLRRRSLLE